MHIEKTKIKDLILLRSEVYKDNRGFFKEINKKKILKKELIFDCVSRSKKILSGDYISKDKIHKVNLSL